MGPYWQAASRPTSRPLCVRCSTSSVSATLVSQFPLLEMIWPKKYRRKLRVCKELKVVSRVRRIEPNSAILPPIELLAFYLMEAAGNTLLPGCRQNDIHRVVHRDDAQHLPGVVYDG